MMPRHQPPDHRGPDAVAGLRRRQEREAAPPIPHVDLGDGQRRYELEGEAARLRRMSLAELRQEADALDLDITTRERPDGDLADDLRFRILERKLGRALGGE